MDSTSALDQFQRAQLDILKAYAVSQGTFQADLKALVRNMEIANAGMRVLGGYNSIAKINTYNLPAPVSMFGSGATGNKTVFVFELKNAKLFRLISQVLYQGTVGTLGPAMMFAALSQGSQQPQPNEFFAMGMPSYSQSQGTTIALGTTVTFDTTIQCAGAQFIHIFGNVTQPTGTDDYFNTAVNQQNTFYQLIA